MSSALTDTSALFSTQQCCFTAVVRLWSVSDNGICNILMMLVKIHHHPSSLLRSKTIFPVNQHPAKFSSGAPSPLWQIKKPWQSCPYLLVFWDGVCFPAAANMVPRVPLMMLKLFNNQQPTFVRNFLTKQTSKQTLVWFVTLHRPEMDVRVFYVTSCTTLWISTSYNKH